MAPSRSRLLPLLLLTLLTPYLLLPIHAASKDEWRKRAIYQVMVDRFARTDGSTTAACNVTNRDYCGGTWAGIQNKLDYIQGMGFDAIWISPMNAGVQGMTGDGADYTGYWVTDMTKPNSNFGTSNDLISLSNELHKRGTHLRLSMLMVGMFLMLDIVVNNMAYKGDPNHVDYGSLQPFNDEKYFHKYCPINYSDRQSTLNVVSLKVMLI
jgi:alpha-amylase